MTVRDRLNVGFDPDTLAELHIRAAAEDRTVPSVVRLLVAYAMEHMPHGWTPPANGERR
jgi:hypothetical protein